MSRKSKGFTVNNGRLGGLLAPTFIIGGIISSVATTPGFSTLTSSSTSLAA
eukprot:CAMPEP_0169408298 /NCGR_PEP_ID=MMETSP1017-20121227/58619_1 /TAXON_ID=342587 /ORGANISM="Karlodinium micrum, Strain CCMP2283" /LENGTH=50 /DNA_ID=CAMNT_0009515379 /DNA_START=336 /DNA_END=485 /DNA_ORIENTATION=+